MKKQIENIFSSKKTQKEIKCPNPKIQIVVDTREKQSLIAANLLEKKANIKFEKLDIGDYLVGDTIIERKTFSDFVGSMMNKRLQEQLINLRKYPQQFLIIEGFYYNYKNERTKVHENAIRGMLLSIAIDFQIPIIYTENEEDTSKFLILTARKYEKPKTDHAIRQTKTARSLEERKQFILEGFPGIGPATAKQLLDNFDSLRDIFNASKEELESTVGLDAGKIQGFLELLRKIQ